MVILDLLTPLVNALVVFFDLVFMSIGDFISTYLPTLSNVVSALEDSFIGFILKASIASLLIGGALVTVVAVLIVKFIIK